MEIIKAKITKDNTLDVTYRDDTGTISFSGKNIVTNDIIESFKKLIPHLAFLTEQKEVNASSGLEDMPENINSILDVTGYSRGGQNESAGVTLVGKRFLQSSKVLNIIAPFTMLENDNEQYDYQFELQQALEVCEYEIKEYLFNKKWRFVQLELDFNEPTASEDISPDIVASADTKDKGSFIEAVTNTSMKVVSSRRRRKTKEVKEA